MCILYFKQLTTNSFLVLTEISGNNSIRFLEPEWKSFNFKFFLLQIKLKKNFTLCARCAVEKEEQKKISTMSRNSVSISTLYSYNPLKY